MGITGNVLIRNLQTNSKKYPTQLTTVQVALVAKATRATCTVVSFAKNSAKTTRNVTHTPPKHYYNLVM